MKEAKTKEEFYSTINQFKKMTSKHPERDVAGAIEKMRANDPANKKPKIADASESED